MMTRQSKHRSHSTPVTSSIWHSSGSFRKKGSWGPLSLQVFLKPQTRRCSAAMETASMATSRDSEATRRSGPPKTWWGTFALASLLNQDPRHQPLSHGGFWKRAGHAVASSVGVRSGSGGVTMNVSNLGGLAAASGLANLWHAGEDRGAKETLTRFGLGLAADALVRLVIELRGSSDKSDKNE